MRRDRRLARLSDRRGDVLRLADACRRARPLRYRHTHRGRRLQTGAVTGGTDRARTDRYRDGFHRRRREIILTWQDRERQVAPTDPRVMIGPERANRAPVSGVCRERPEGGQYGAGDPESERRTAEDRRPAA